MSLFLYRLGRFIGAHRGLIVIGWIVVLLAVGGAAGVLKSNYDDTFTLPGSQSQAGQDLLSQRFSQSGSSGSTGQAVMSLQTGKITDADAAAEVKGIASAVDDVAGVSMTDPLSLDEPVLSKDGRAVLGQVLFADQKPSQGTLDAVVRAADHASTSTVKVTVGGAPYNSDTAKTSKLPELLGLVVAFLILVVTFGSFLAAGMPLITAIIGVAVTLSGVVVASNFGTISDTSPTLAEMLGLAVGIDYALFLLSRHRKQLETGLDPVESMARAMATAGSAVVFAGATVVIALCGLSITGIPILTVMGLAAAAAVLIAVVIALTLVPAIALLLGSRLRPRSRRTRRSPTTTTPVDGRVEVHPSPPRGLSAAWLRLVTRRPLITVIVVVVGLGVVALPAFSISLALPDASTASTSTPAGETYQTISRDFGPGYTAPLSVAANIISSSDPKKTVDTLADDIKKIDGVEAVTQATPNESADTALIQVIPKGGQSDPRTAALVSRLRADAPALEKKAGVSDILVAGTTAITLDVSAKLAGALVPFGAVVIGLSLILLMIVFRSIAVPLKATFGYLLSVGAALGSVVAVFQWGWLGPGLETGTGTVVSFLPIFIMGVLFGLAMDYEMFLVSRMREDYAHTGDARASIRTGFASSSKVVTAAALIMGSVFLAFVPTGSTTIQPIALGLAIGVFVDAFLVRMTLVPAVLQLLGRHAWWIPRWLDRVLPVVDVEGQALERYVRYLDWCADNDADCAIWSRELTLQAGGPRFDLTIAPGTSVALVVPDVMTGHALARAVTGRGTTGGGDLVVAGELLPQRKAVVLTTTAIIDLAQKRQLGRGTPESLLPTINRRAAEVCWTAPRRRRFAARTLDVLDETIGAYDSSGTANLDSVQLQFALAVAGGATIVVIVGTGAPHEPAERQRIGRMAAAASALSVTFVLMSPEPISPADAAGLDVIGAHLSPLPIPAEPADRGPHGTAGRLEGTKTLS